MTVNSDQSATGKTPVYRSSKAPSQLQHAFSNGAIPVAVYGLGKMGLPLAAVFAETTGNTVGVDIDSTVVTAINDGTCPVDGEPGLGELVGETVETGGLEATTDAETAASKARVHVVIVPTLVDDGDPDMANLQAAVEAIGRGLSAGDLVCIESTVPPKTCTDLVEPILEAESGLDREEFGVAFCPERTASGSALEDIQGSYPKVVGGVDAESTKAASLVYECITENDVHTVSDATTAECVKVFEGVYRDVNIALANELARLGDELAIDVREAIDIANTQPYCEIHRPGPGVGGHCIPYYPYFLIEALETETPLLETARGVNDGMPTFTVDKLLTLLADRGVVPSDATVAVLGIAYRPGVDETCESPGLAIAEQLARRGVQVSLVDPVVDTEPFEYDEISVESLASAEFDAAVLVTAHEQFTSLSPADFGDTVVVDGRDALRNSNNSPYIYTLGAGD